MSTLEISTLTSTQNL